MKSKFPAYASIITAITVLIIILIALIAVIKFTKPDDTTIYNKETIELEVPDGYVLDENNPYDYQYTVKGLEIIVNYNKENIDD